MGRLKIGDFDLPCAVLDDETRVICVDPAEDGASGPDGQALRLPLSELLASENLQPFIPNELAHAVTAPILFREKPRGKARGAIDATALPAACEALVRARNSGALTPDQEPAADAAETLNAALSRVGIIALIDEATGYQRKRRRDALHKILEAYISPELLRWTKRFPDVFYEELFRLKGWPFDPPRPRKPQVVGHLTNDIVYRRLPPGVLEELQRKNPVDPVTGRRPARHHQWLTDDIGHPKLQGHLIGVLAVMRAALSWPSFCRMLNRSYPVGDAVQLEAFEEDVE